MRLEIRFCLWCLAVFIILDLAADVGRDAYWLSWRSAAEGALTLGALSLFAGKCWPTMTGAVDK